MDQARHLDFAALDHDPVRERAPWRLMEAEAAHQDVAETDDQSAAHNTWKRQRRPRSVVRAHARRIQQNPEWVSAKGILHEPERLIEKCNCFRNEMGPASRAWM